MISSRLSSSGKHYHCSISPSNALKHKDRKSAHLAQDLALDFDATVYKPQGYEK